MNDRRPPFALAAVIMFLACLGPRHATASPNVTIITRAGERQTLPFSDFDDDHLIFKFRVARHERAFELQDVAALVVTSQGSAGSPVPADSLDRFTLTDGRTVRGIFSRLDAKKVHVWLAGASDVTAIPIDSLREISFARNVLPVDRREFGRGFNLFGETTELILASYCAQSVEAEASLLDDSVTAAYVTAVGERVAAASKRPSLPYTFKVINSGTVDAFTVGGGRVYVCRGLLEKLASESELAALLAHEIGHNVGKHVARLLSQKLLAQSIVTAASGLAETRDRSWGEAFRRVGGALAFFKTMEYSRDEERDADLLAVYNVDRAGLDPAGVVGLFETLKRCEAGQSARAPAGFSDHPDITERIADARTEVQKLATARPPGNSPAFQLMEERLAALPRPIVNQVLVANTMVVPALQRQLSTFSIDLGIMKDCRLQGTFFATGGSGNDIRVLPLDEAGRVDYLAGRKARTLFDSGVQNNGTLDVAVPTSGIYYLVLDNGFSLVSAKTIVVNVRVQYRE